MRYLGGAVGHRQGATPLSSTAFQPTQTADGAADDEWIDVHTGGDVDGEVEPDEPEDEAEGGYVPSEDEPDNDDDGGEGQEAQQHSGDEDSESEPEIGPEDGENDDLVEDDLEFANA